MSIRRVMIEVEFTDGSLMRQVVLKPDPQGDNPMFLEQQLDSGVQDASHSLALGIRAMRGRQRLANGSVTE